jgi:hypothetical protein
VWSSDWADPQRPVLRTRKPPRAKASSYYHPDEDGTMPPFWCRFRSKTVVDVRRRIRKLWSKYGGLGLCVVASLLSPLASQPIAVAQLVPARPKSSSAASLTAQDQLDAVSCVTAADCQAVGIRTNTAAGFNTMLAEHWNGRSWTMAPSYGANGLSTLSDVSCVSPTFCMAVGVRREALVESWNGSSWTVAAGPSNPDHEQLDAVACVAATKCFVSGDTTAADLLGQVGGSYNAAIWESDGSTWTKQPIFGVRLTYTSISSVACAGDAFCLALGTSQLSPTSNTWRPVTLRLSTGRWQVVASAVSPLSTLSCSPQGLCLAIGATKSGHLVGERWNGQSWSRVPPSPVIGSIQNQSVALACFSATNCLSAVTVSTKMTESYLSVLWAGGKWKIIPMLTPARLQNSAPQSISCPTAKDCEVVTWWQASSLTGQPPSLMTHSVVEQWKGTTWHLQPTR